MPTAAVVIIGDEILSGKFPDENGPFLIRRLRTLGCDLGRLVFVPDRVPVIAAEIRACAAAFDHVITTGGVGPTHDDITYEAIAAAFDVPIEAHSELVALLERYGLVLSATNLRMASVPAGTELVYGGPTRFPVVKVRNVLVFPGVPRLLQQKFGVVEPLLTGASVRVVRVYVDEPEVDIAERLFELAAAHPRVSIGSYPRHDEAGYEVIVTVESRDGDAVDDAVKDLREALRWVEGPV